MLDHHKHNTKQCANEQCTTNSDNYTSIACTIKNQQTSGKLMQAYVQNNTHFLYSVITNGNVTKLCAN